MCVPVTVAGMRQLSGLDTTFLNLETRNTPLHVASVILVDPSTAPNGFGYEQVKALIAERLHLLGPYRERLVEVPFGLDQPYWIDDPDFDLEFHVRRIAVPAPGDEGTFADIAARIHARPLDRSRPLWECYVIEGLASGHVAILSKTHHAAIDGVSGGEMLSILLDLEADAPARPAPPSRRPTERMPSNTMLGLLAAKGFVKAPGRTARAAFRTVTSLPQLARLADLPVPFMDRGTSPLARPSMQAPRTMFNAALSPHRRFAYGSLSLTEVKRIKNHHGVTVNDVLMAVCAGALREHLLQHGDLPAAPLQAMVPISVRTEAQAGSMGNQVSAMIATLPTNIADPVERLTTQSGSMKVAKERNAVPADLIQDVTKVVAPAVFALAARAITNLNWADHVRIPFNVVISNVPGPPIPVYMAGAKLQGIFPLSAIADGVGFNITVFSYLDEINIGLIADREMVDDLWPFIDLMRDELDALSKATPHDDGGAEA